MRILSIESSCDETSASVVEKKGNKIIVLSSVTATSLAIHAKTGGIIPENAAREQVKYIMPLIVKALLKSRKNSQIAKQLNSFTHRENNNSTIQQFNRSNEVLADHIDAIAVTYGPGLIGSLLVGVETVKTLAYTFNKPVIPVNHLLAHLFANFITVNREPKTVNFPWIGLIVSGGHTDLLYFKSITEFEWLGGTRDDAAGEALDKIGRLLGLSYPAGAEIEKRAKLGQDTKIRFKSPIMDEETFDFSFSGLKTEVLRFVQNQARGGAGGRAPDSPQSSKTSEHWREGEPATGPRAISEKLTNEICFAVQKAVLDVLVKKTLAAAEKYKVKTVLLGGGVSANKTLFEKFRLKVRSQTVPAGRQELEVEIFSPEKKYCTDNAAMIGAYALLNPKEKPWREIYAEPDLYFG